MRRRRSRDRRPPKAIKFRPVTEPVRAVSPTAVAAEALQTGILRGAVRRRWQIPREDETILVGDPDDSTLANEYVGEDTPGGSTSTPDQSNVDDIGRAYGLQEEDTGALRSAAEVLSRRDRHRSELRPFRRP